MKRVINRIAIITILCMLISGFNTNPVSADYTVWVEDKPARLVSYKYHDESECSVCGKFFVYELEYVLETDLNGRTAYGSAHLYGGQGHFTDYNCSGDYYCVSPQIVEYVEMYNYKVYDTMDYPSEAAKHLKSHGLDSDGNSACLVFGDSCTSSYYYGEQYKEAEGHYETVPSGDSPTTPATTNTSTESSSSSKSPSGNTTGKSYSNTSANLVNRKNTGSSLFGVSLTKVSKGKKNFTAKWKKASKKQQKKFSGYQIQYSTSPNFTIGVKTKSTTKKKASKVVIRKLKAKTNYYVRIRRFKKSGGKVVYSDWSNVKRVRTK